MRVRFAPSPTGYLHIGNARTALINYLIARREGAGYTLRIEDTDMERSSRESEESIINDLNWLGITWDEGPDTGGDRGPYRQSERYDIYRQYTESLLEKGKAYPCYCSSEELDRLRREAEAGNTSFVYPGTCRDLTEDERRAKESQGIKPAIRFRLPSGENIVFNDLIKGQVTFSSENIGGDFIIVRSDGNPIYNYIVTIDDTLMGVTHVIRGEDHLSNTPKQVCIARALELPEPVYAHHSLILGPDRSKLSKRHGITSVAMYREEGYLPQALVNYLGLLGWATESGKEIVSLEELTGEFSLDGLGKSSPVFDFDKLRWVNGHYIRNYDLSAITDLFIPHLEKNGFDVSNLERERLENIIDVLRIKCEVLSDIGEFAGIFLNEVNEPDPETANLLATEQGITIIKAARELLEEGMDSSSFAERFIPSLKEKTSLKGKNLFHPIRALVTGRLNGPELDVALPLIGYEALTRRILYAYERFCSGE
jgi:glutamyl-tRNA synthetase